MNVSTVRIPQAGSCARMSDGEEFTFSRMPPKGDRPDMVDLWKGPYETELWVTSNCRMTLEEFVNTHSVIAVYQ
jgi:hypothetical protein